MSILLWNLVLMKWKGIFIRLILLHCRDGVERVVAFSQYPQYSCATSGSSLNAIVRHYESEEKTFNGVESIELPSVQNKSPGPIWSFIDRWPVFPPLVNSFANKILGELQSINDETERANTVLIFSAHSVPLSVVNRGDPYPQVGLRHLWSVDA